MEEINNFKEKLYIFIEEVNENHVIHYMADNPEGRINIPSKEEVIKSDEILKDTALELAYSLYRLIENEKVEIKLNKNTEITIKGEN